MPPSSNIKFLGGRHIHPSTTRKMIPRVYATVHQSFLAINTIEMKLSKPGLTPADVGLNGILPHGQNTLKILKQQWGVPYGNTEIELPNFNDNGNPQFTVLTTQLDPGLYMISGYFHLYSKNASITNVIFGITYTTDSDYIKHTTTETNAVGLGVAHYLPATTVIPIDTSSPSNLTIKLETRFQGTGDLTLYRYTLYIYKLP